jgi:cytochrome c biogenesis protein CcdA
VTKEVRRNWPVLGREHRRRVGLDPGSALLAILLLIQVACVIVGAETVFFACIVSAWLLLTALVGYRNVLDAGCLYMLISLGIVVIVDLAGHARIPLPT